jgi:hypothetical protein
MRLFAHFSLSAALPFAACTRAAALPDPVSPLTASASPSPATCLSPTHPVQIVDPAGDVSPAFIDLVSASAELTDSDLIVEFTVSDLSGPVAIGHGGPDVRELRYAALIDIQDGSTLEACVTRFNLSSGLEAGEYSMKALAPSLQNTLWLRGDGGAKSISSAARMFRENTFRLTIARDSHDALQGDSVCLPVRFETFYLTPDGKEVGDNEA